MAKAPKSALEELHEAVARGLKERLADAKNATAADFQAAIQFLKQNGINIDGSAIVPSERPTPLTETLPFVEDPEQAREAG